MCILFDYKLPKILHISENEQKKKKQIRQKNIIDNLICCNVYHYGTQSRCRRLLAVGTGCADGGRRYLSVGLG
jgi:hypothetical protein